MPANPSLFPKEREDLFKFEPRMRTRVRRALKRYPNGPYACELSTWLMTGDTPAAAKALDSARSRNPRYPAAPAVDPAGRAHELCAQLIQHHSLYAGLHLFIPDYLAQMEATFNYLKSYGI